MFDIGIYALFILGFLSGLWEGEISGLIVEYIRVVYKYMGKI